MNRRNFLAGLGALVGGLAIEQAIPLGRVWSFPSKIVVPRTLQFDPNPFAFTLQDGDIVSFAPGIAGFDPNQLYQIRSEVFYPSKFRAGEVGTLYGFDTP